jgi:hypothetical protein
MNPIDHQLARLFRSAARAERLAPDTAVPFAMEEQVIAAWHRNAAVEENDEALFVLFRRVLIAACLIALLALAASYEELVGTNDGEFHTATAALQVTIAP